MAFSLLLIIIIIYFFFFLSFGVCPMTFSMLFESVQSFSSQGLRVFEGLAGIKVRLGTV